MGIKFLCPNGHKLHVKSFLSGKKAICPKCGARVVVPEADSSVLGGPETDTTAGESTILFGDSPIGSAGGLSAVGGSSGAPTASAAPSHAVSTGPASDPIADAPSAVWYVRPATGGQFGPASGEIMRAWISEGRVGASSFVWRAGWPEWRSAAGIFPQLEPRLATPGISVSPPSRVATATRPANLQNGASQESSELPVGQVPQTLARPLPIQGEAPAPGVTLLSHGGRKKRRDKDLSLIVSAVLLVISIILVAILIMVWRNRSAGESSTPAPDQAHQTSPAPSGLVRA